MGVPKALIRNAGRIACGVAAVALIGACGDDDATTPTTAAPTTAPATTPSTTEPVPDTTSMGSNVESLSYLIQGLLTSEQIGGGWVDQGRQIVPPGSNQLAGFLCEEGEAAVAELGGRLDPQVSTSFRRASDVGLSVFENLMWGDRQQLTDDVAAFTAAVEACAGTAYATTDLGEVSLGMDPAPDLGTAAVSFHFGPATVPSDTPWLEQRVTTVLLSDPSQPVALVVTVGALVIHDPSTAEPTVLEPAEYDRIVAAAIDRIMQGL
jgi:hypothetical protein